MAQDTARERMEVLAELVEDAPCGIVITDPDGTLQYVNETLNRWLGLSGASSDKPARLPDLMTLPGQLFYETHLSPMMRIQGFVREISCALKVEDGVPLPVLITGMSRYDAQGNAIRFDYTIFDARERRAYEDELRNARGKADELAAIVRTSPNAILSVDPAGRIGSWNAGAERLLGLPKDAFADRPVAETIPFEECPNWFEWATAGRTKGGEVVFEASYRQGCEVEVTVTPINEQDEPGATRGYSIVLRDISQRKKAERRVQLALGEMKHRVKNTLAVVSGVARQTLPTEVRDAFISRMHALFRAHDALGEEHQEGADLRDLLRSTAEQAGGQERFRINGPNVQLPPQQVTSLSMALHELATNAIKYGALSGAEGHVRVDFGPEQGSGKIRLVWHERDGPAVIHPTRHGFGSKMINTVLKSDLSADVDFDYRPDGVRCEIVFMPGTTE